MIDASANCLIVKAYEYTTILSIMLCDAMCIPATVVISLIFLHSKFALRHYIAVLLCLTGLAIMIVHDALKSSSGTHRVIGDLMALSSSVLYAVSNVCQEVLVKHNDWVCSAPSLLCSERIPWNDRSGRHRCLSRLYHPL